MAILVLVTSVGFTIDQHVCGGRLKSFNLTGKAKTCYELATGDTNKTCIKQDTDSYQGLAITKKKCCEGRSEYFQSDTEISPSSGHSLDVHFQQFIVAYITVFVDSPLFVRTKRAYLSYKPPILYRNIPVLIQSFLL